MRVVGGAFEIMKDEAGNIVLEPMGDDNPLASTADDTGDHAAAEETRQRVARDITRESMGRVGRVTAFLKGWRGEYTPEAYEAAWAAPTKPHTDGAAR